jgi:hypothetical protein
MAEAVTTVNIPTPTPAEQQAAAQSEQSLILGKFKSQDELIESYKQLEQKLGQQKPAEQQQPAVKEPTQQQALELSKFAGEFSQTGNLSDDSRKALNTHGITNEVIDSYIKGQQALAQSQVHPILEQVGGQAEYAKMVNWAAANWSEEDRSAYNEDVNSGDPTRMSFAVKSLKSLFTEANGRPPQLLGGKSTSSTDQFRSWAEVNAAMANPKYHADPAYRNDVDRKVERSPL